MTRSSGVRPLTDDELQRLSAGLRSSSAFVLRRAQILLASARGQRPAAIAAAMGCSEQTARSAIAAFNRHGMEALKARSTRPRTVRAAYDAKGLLGLWELLHRSPRAYRRLANRWTLGLAAEVSHAEGLVSQRVSGETVRATLSRVGVSWERARKLIDHPDPAYLERHFRLAA